MRLLRSEKYRKCSIRVYVMANLQHVCKIKLPNDSRYYEITDYPMIDTVDNLIECAKQEISDYYVDENGVEYE